MTTIKTMKLNADEILFRDKTIKDYLLSDSNCLDDRYYTETEIDNKVDEINTNLNNKADKDGTGASGTWNININGNATNDDKGNKISETYLPLSGGALNGIYIARNVDNSKLVLYGGNGYHHGAQINIHGLDLENEKGAVNIETYNGSTSAILKLLSDGTLKWNGYDLAGSAIVAQSFGINGYIKYVGGLTIQWGQVILSTSEGVKIPLNIATPTNGIAFVTPAENKYKQTFSVSARVTTTELTVVRTSIDTPDDILVNWFAIGY